MSMLETAYARGQFAALQHHKLAFAAPTNPTVRQSAVLRAAPAQAPAPAIAEAAQPRLTPQTLARQFDNVEQSETRIEPLRKLSAAPNVRVVDDQMLAHILHGGVVPGIAGMALGGLTSDEHPVRNALIGAGLGAGLGSLGAGLGRRLENQNLARLWASKLGADLCTTCRKPKHYGSCKTPKPIPSKQANFNAGMTGDDSSSGDNPSTSPHYSSATSSTSALTRAQEGRPASEQAATAFRDLLRSRDLTMSDQAERSTAGLDKVSQWLRVAAEQRGPTVNPYAEHPTHSVPPAGGIGMDADRAWRSFDTVNDSTAIDGGAGTPSGGPAA